jgi:hypothetical protein
MAIADAPLRSGWAVFPSGIERMNGRSIALFDRLCEQAFCVKTSGLRFISGKSSWPAVTAVWHNLERMDEIQSRSPEAGIQGEA